MADGSPDTSSDNGEQAEQVDSIVAMALLGGLVDDQQVTEVEQLCEKLKGDGIEMSVPEGLVKKGYLTDKQIGEIDRKRRAAKFAESIPGYRIETKLGSGAVGFVYKAFQKSMNRYVAIKILNPKLANRPGFAERFLREAHASAKVSHANIMAGLDAGEAHGLKYFVMEYVEGETLRARMKREGRLQEREVHALATQLAGALIAAEKAGLVHRDIKPDNIMIATTGQAKLCDLGLSRMEGEDSSLTQSGHALGTPFYISPEQARGQKDVDGRTDQYALGATLYHLLTGQPLFDAETSAATMTAHLVQEAKAPQSLNPEISNGMVAILRKLTAKEPAHRYASATELLADLEELRQGRPVGAFAFQEKSSIPAGFAESGTGTGAPAVFAAESGEELKIEFADDPPATVATGASVRSPHASPAGAIYPMAGQTHRAKRTPPPQGASMGIKLLAGIGLLAIGALIALVINSQGKETERKKEKVADKSVESGRSKKTSAAKKSSSAPPRRAKQPQKRKPPRKTTRPTKPPPKSVGTVGVGRTVAKIPRDVPRKKLLPEHDPRRPEVDPRTGNSIPASGEEPPPPPSTEVETFVIDPGGEPPPPRIVDDPSGGNTGVAPGPATAPRETPSKPEPTPLSEPSGPWDYAFIKDSEMNDWKSIENGWSVSKGRLYCASQALIQRIEWKKELKGDVVIRYEGRSAADLGLSIVDAKDSSKVDRIVVGGMTGTQVGIFSTGGGDPALAELAPALDRRRKVEVARKGGKLSLVVDGKKVSQDVAGTVDASASFKIQFSLWDNSGSFERVSIQTPSSKK